MLRSVKASIAVAAELRSRIARGVLAADAPLPVEDDLAVELGCSKPVVREALRILETEGLVEVRRGVGGGARVRHPSIYDAAKTMGVYLQIGDVAVLDVWTARDRIIAAAVERLAGGGVDLAPLVAAVDALAANVGDMPAFNANMLDVGEIAVHAAGNATEHALVAALRHIVAAEVTVAAARVEDPVGLGYATREEAAIAEAWRRTVGHVRGGRPRAARQAYERQADALRALVGASMAGATVGDAAVLL
ncbi:MAG: putative GntR-family transcriptional regulator [Actinomycetia bacterium]|nr:putative GntR-family transcriptional regulator [Actinomycetes bacterium]